MNELAMPSNLVKDNGNHHFGGKALALGRMIKGGLKVPPAVCLSTQAYNLFVDSTGLRGKIMLELSRKRFEDMRWEEIWDVSLRIRALFNSTLIPSDLKMAMMKAFEPVFHEKPVVVRSSAVGEDASNSSFAGIHESYVNVRGTEAIMGRIKLVWASLWSDAAMLYRKELGLTVEESTMAVVVQEMIEGQRSGVAFGINPNEPSQAVIEAVYGLNQGLVDGSVEPDRWILDRSKGDVLQHYEPIRDKAAVLSPEGVSLEPLASELGQNSPLSSQELTEVFNLTRRVEDIFGSPQDVEWTYEGSELYVLQSRPITTPPKDDDSNRVWYLSLRRSFQNLKALRKRIEQEHIPGMIEAAGLGRELSELTNADLAEEIEYRVGVYQKWHDIYWEEFIPFAHGVRLFAQVYNDVMKPKDPFEFMDLLVGAEMLSLQRNRLLEEMAERFRSDSDLAKRLRSGIDDDLLDMLDEFLEKFAGAYKGDHLAREGLIDLIREMAKNPIRKKIIDIGSLSNRKEAFFANFPGEQRTNAKELLDLARASYRLRDDDNIYLGKIEANVSKVEHEGLRRLGLKYKTSSEEIIKALRDPGYIPEKEKNVDRPANFAARQLVGQPASMGIGSGAARVVIDQADLFSFKAGEVLVCDAVDPNMTFVVPLCSAIVERRGGMLIHGAIIAREYGIPCVTGVPEAAELIETGDILTVDGYLGIVTIEKRNLQKNWVQAQDI
jgi:pyruvate,water dikinase